MEPSEQLVQALAWIGRAITPPNAAPAKIGSREVGSLTEAMMYIGDGLQRIADALADIADSQK